MFKVGDLIIGKDQSYKRSIYQVLDPTEVAGTFLVKLLAYGNNLFIYHVQNQPMRRRVDEFRLATEEELDRELDGAYRNHLIEFVDRLISTRSDRELL